MKFERLQIQLDESPVVLLKYMKQKNYENVGIVKSFVKLKHPQGKILLLDLFRNEH